MSNPKREAMLCRIEDWHGRDEHIEILSELDKIPREFWDYEVTCLYARALNNLERWEEALEFLISVKSQGRSDKLWHFRIGYSLYFLGGEKEAAAHFQKAIDLGDTSESARQLLAGCRVEPEKKENERETVFPELYPQEELELVEKHIEKYFGAYKNVFHEIESPDIHVDIIIIEPTPKRNYFSLVTLGMGAHKMDVPKNYRKVNPRRAELMVCLPPGWRLDRVEEETWYWPLRWLKVLARLPVRANTWLAWGHTIPSGGPFDKSTELNSMMLVSPGAFPKKSHTCALPDGDTLSFYQLLPLYEGELNYKLRYGVGALLKLMSAKDLECVNPSRKPVIKTDL